MNYSFVLNNVVFLKFSLSILIFSEKFTAIVYFWQSRKPVSNRNYGTRIWSEGNLWWALHFLCCAPPKDHPFLYLGTEMHSFSRFYAICFFARCTLLSMFCTFHCMYLHQISSQAELIVLCVRSIFYHIYSSQHSGFSHKYL